MATININNMRFYAHHGCFPEERKIGTHFSVNVSFEYDALQAATTDNIDYAVNYLAVYQLVAQEMKQSSNLIEAVALRIKDKLLSAFPQMEQVRVSVRKLNPPLGGEVEEVSVEL